MRIGVIDIGSNSIKLLIADKGSTIAVVYQMTWETRISDGLHKHARLSEESMALGVLSVKRLLEEAHSYRPQKMCIVATSAIRDAENRDTFIEWIRDATGYELNVLTGEEEADYIAQGICTDPSLEGQETFSVCDLGGGSLECINFKNNQIEHRISLNLGAVRLAEQFIKDPNGPVTAQEASAIAAYLRQTLTESSFKFPAEVETLVGTGGALNACRSIRADWLGKTFKTVDSFISLDFLKYLYKEIAPIALRERVFIKELPPERADIMPAALLILINLAEYANVDGYTHSLHNLRFGIVAEMQTESA